MTTAPSIKKRELSAWAMRTIVRKCLLPLLVLTLLVARLTGLIDTRSAIITFLIFEGIILLIAGWKVHDARNRYRGALSAGQDSWEAIELALGAFLPQVGARLVAHELRIFWCLWQRMFRRHALGPGEFSYIKRSILGALLLVIAITVPVEIAVLHLLLPWEWLKWAMIVLSVYGLIWFVGLWASFHIMPHRMESDGLRLRYGTLAEAFVPYDGIDDFVAERTGSPESKEGLVVSRDKRVGYLAVGGRTDVGIRLRVALPIQGFLRKTAPVSILRIAVDTPEEFVSELRCRLERQEHSPTLSAASRRCNADGRDHARGGDRDRHGITAHYTP